MDGEVKTGAVRSQSFYTRRHILRCRYLDFLDPRCLMPGGGPPRYLVKFGAVGASSVGGVDLRSHIRSERSTQTRVFLMYCMI